MADKLDYVAQENVSRTLGREAQRNNILAVKIIADIVKTTLGPKGMDKMLVDSVGNITITNDGVTILEEMELEHPAAKLIVEIAKTQEQEVGDGTTTVAMLAGKLLENAEKLIDRKVHPTSIVRGYRLAAEKSGEILKELCVNVDSIEILKKIASTAMTGKGAEGNRNKFAEIIVEAINQISDKNEVNLENIKITKIRGGKVENSALIRGLVLDKEIAHQDMPHKIMNAKIALLDAPLEIRTPETETKITISTPEQLENFLEAEESFLRNVTDKIKESGANAVFCQKGMDDVAQYYLAKHGIAAVRRVGRSDMEKIEKATSGKIVSNLNELNSGQLGYAEVVEEIKHGDEKFTYIRGCKNPKAVSILIFGTSPHVIDEFERAIEDGLGVVASAVREGKIVAGGGAVEIELARRLRNFAKTLGGKEQLAVEEFANSLETIPETLAENAGLDAIEILAELKRRHETERKYDGLDLLNDGIANCLDAGIIEPLKVKTQAINAASEVASMILRIDDVLIASRHAESKRDVIE